MMTCEEYCSICLQNDPCLKSINENDDSDTTFLSKLQTIAPSQDWQDFYIICNECTSLLNISYKFHGMCCGLEEQRKQTVIKKEIYIATDSDNHDLPNTEENDDEDCFDCDLCKAEFTNNDELLKHIKEHHVCDMCNEEFSSKRILIAHKKLKHKSCSKEKKKGNIIPDKFFCEFCSEKFSYVKHLTKHYVTVHSIPIKEARPYSCSICLNRFNSSGTLYQHKRYHLGYRTYICSICGKGFITKRDLINHEVIHSEQRNYKCEPCNKSFISNKNLRTHNLIVHTDSKLWKFECGVCGRRFAMKSSFDQHLLRHTGEKKFPCHICANKSFVTNIELRRHLDRHTNVKHNKCEHCSKEYRNKQSLTSHLASFHGIGKLKIVVKEKKHACTFCPSKFYDKNKLTRHIYTHTGERPFSCYVCDKRFTDKSYVKGHLKTVHGILEENTNT